MSTTSVFYSFSDSASSDTFSGVSPRWDRDNYKDLILIGCGKDSEVYQATCLYTRSQVAVKILDLSKCGCPERIPPNQNILGSFCQIFVDNTIWIVMPLMSLGCLQTVSFTYFRYGILEKNLAPIMKEIANGLVNLHARGFIHGALKASNIAVGSSWSIKIADCGVSFSYFNSESLKNSSVPYWIPPEVIQSPYALNLKSDIYCFGVLALELAYGAPPVSDLKSLKSICQKVSERFPHYSDIEKLVRNNVFDREFSDSFKNLIGLCLSQYSVLRPSADQILKHPFFINCGLPEDHFKNIGKDMISLPDRFKEHEDRIRAFMRSGSKDDHHCSFCINADANRICNWDLNLLTFELTARNHNTAISNLEKLLTTVDLQREIIMPLIKGRVDD